MLEVITLKNKQHLPQNFTRTSFILIYCLSFKKQHIVSVWNTTTPHLNSAANLYLRIILVRLGNTTTTKLVVRSCVCPNTAKWVGKRKLWPPVDLKPPKIGPIDWMITPSTRRSTTVPIFVEIGRKGSATPIAPFYDDVIINVTFDQIKDNTGLRFQGACFLVSIFTAPCTIVRIAVLRSHVVCCLSVCDGGLWSHRLRILETNCTDN